MKYLKRIDESFYPHTIIDKIKSSIDNIKDILDSILEEDDIQYEINIILYDFTSKPTVRNLRFGQTRPEFLKSNYYIFKEDMSPIERSKHGQVRLRLNEFYLDDHIQELEQYKIAYQVMLGVIISCPRSILNTESYNKIDLATKRLNREFMECNIIQRTSIPPPFDSVSNPLRTDMAMYSSRYNYVLVYKLNI